jgi:hypothetical protein
MAFTLGDISWNDPLSRLNTGGVTSHPYRRQLEYLKAIWNRLTDDYRNVSQNWEWQQELLKQSGGHEFSKEEMFEYQKWLDSVVLLDLDYDSFVIHSKILMDKISMFTALLLRNRQNPPPSTFSKQRKFFFAPENVPYQPNESYAAVVRRADWFELCLKTTRDVMVVHSIPNIGGGVMLSPREGKLRPLRNRWGWSKSLDVNAGELRSLKEKYASKYPELAKLDNYWLIADFFTNTDLELEKTDVAEIARIVRATGGYMPDLNYLADHVMGFLRQTAMAFGMTE